MLVRKDRVPYWPDSQQKAGQETVDSDWARWNETVWLATGLGLYSLSITMQYITSDVSCLALFVIVANNYII